MPGEPIIRAYGVSPVRWIAAGALGGASIVGMLWALLGRAPMPLAPVIPPASGVVETSPVFTPEVAAAPTPSERGAPSEPVEPARATSLAATEPVGTPDPVPRPTSPTDAPSGADAAPSSQPAPAREPAPAGRLDINTATKAELELLPRIGPTLAQRIIEFRAAEGRIRSLTHLTDVKGIGVRTAEILEPYLRFD